ncbi:MAG: branched-chain amino acid transaminase [Candidatus Dormibacteria bacterium]
MTTTAPSNAPDAVTRRETSWIWFNGEFCRYQDAKIGLLTHGLNYGTGVFEGIRAYWNAERSQLYTLRMAEHYERMHTNARILQMEVPLPAAELCTITTELLQRNQYREDVYIRPLIFKSAEIIGVKLHDVPDAFAICTAPMGNYVGTAGIRCVVSSWRRIDDTMMPARSKCSGNYVNSALAKSEALQAGMDEAILLTNDGHVCEGSAENIFLVRKGTLVTPPVSDNILEGITRDTVIQLATEEMGLEVIERSVDRSELYTADEVLMCGTGAQIAPVVEIDRRRVGDGEPGPITNRLQDMYTALVTGRNDTYAEWLTPVY